MREEYKVPRENVSTAVAKIEKLNARAERLGVPGVTLTRSKEITATYRDDITGKEHVSLYTMLTLEGEDVKLNGWTFLSHIYHTSEGNILQTVPGKEVPVRFRDGGPVCEHCGYDRRRADTFLVQNEQGEVKQVGSTCLHDFLGIDPHRILAWAKFVADMMESMNEYCGGGYSEPCVSLPIFLFEAAREIKRHGYRSSKKCQEEQCGCPTGTMLFTNMVCREPSKTEREYFAENFEIPAEDAERLAIGTSWWIGSLEGNQDLNDYLHNLRVAFSVGYVVGRTANLVASSIVSFEREYGLYTKKETEETELQRLRRTSQFLGEVGERREFEVTVGRSFTTQTDFGTCYIQQFTTTDGCRLTTFSSNQFGKWETNAETGAIKFVPYGEEEVIKIVGTVKRHQVYKEIKQTILSRVSLAKPKKEKKVRAKKEVSEQKGLISL